MKTFIKHVVFTTFFVIIGASFLTFSGCKPSQNVHVVLEKTVFADSTCSYFMASQVSSPLKDSIEAGRLEIMKQIYESSFVSDDVQGWEESKKTTETAYNPAPEDSSACPGSQILVNADRYYQNAKIISIVYTYYMYTCGANANYGQFCATFDKQNGTKIGMNELITDQATFLTLAEKAFRKTYKIPDTAKLNDYNCLMFENNQFSMPSQFEFTQEGIKFSYNLYEIACRVDGLYEFTIPYAELQNIVNKEYLKEK